MLRPDVDNFYKYGYVLNGDAHDAASLTLEYAFDHAAVANGAAAAGRADVAARFAPYASYYKHAWEPSTQLMCARNETGDFFCPAEPWLIYPIGDSYTEGDAWQWRWFAPQVRRTATRARAALQCTHTGALQDGYGVVDLFPSVAAYNDELYAFLYLEKDWIFGNALPNAWYWCGGPPAHPPTHLHACVSACVCLYSMPCTCVMRACLPALRVARHMCARPPDSRAPACPDT